MIGTFNDYIAADVEATRQRNAARKGTCLYYRDGACASEKEPRCPHYSLTLCTGAGDCSRFFRHYQTPLAILREEALSV